MSENDEFLTLLNEWKRANGRVKWTFGLPSLAGIGRLVYFTEFLGLHGMPQEFFSFLVIGGMFALAFLVQHDLDRIKKPLIAFDNRLIARALNLQESEVEEMTKSRDW